MTTISLHKMETVLKWSSENSIAEFTFRGFKEDDEAVALTYVNRCVKVDPLSEEFVSKLIPSYRYWNVAKWNLIQILLEILLLSILILTFF